MQLVFAEFCLWEDVNPGKKIIEQLGSPKDDLQDSRGQNQGGKAPPGKLRIWGMNAYISAQSTRSTFESFWAILRFSTFWEDQISKYDFEKI